MKKSKLLFLLLALLCVSLTLASCSIGKGGGLLEYFDLEDTSPLSYATIEKYDGVIIDRHENIIVTQETEIDVLNNVVETFKIIDTQEGKILFETEGSYPKNYEFSDSYNVTRRSVILDYPVIITEDTNVSRYEKEEERVSYTYNYYLVNGTQLETFSSDEELRLYYGEWERQDDYVRYANEKISGVYIYTTRSTTYYIAKNGDTLESYRSENAVNYITNNYNYSDEYRGYLYSTGRDGVTVYNKMGLSVASYSAPMSEDVMVQTHVLNNGKVLIQELTHLDDSAEAYDIIDGKSKYNLKSYILDNITAELKEVELDYVISILESRYAAEDNEYSIFPFALNEEQENQAYITRITDKLVLTENAEYAVIDNDGNVVFSLRSAKDGKNLVSVQPLFDKYFVCISAYGDKECYEIYDLNCKLVTTVYEYGEDDMILPVNDKYLVCNSGIYDINLKLVYSFVENGITNYDVIADNVIIYKNSPVLYDDEIGNVENAAYRYDFETGKLVLVANGYTTRLANYDYSYYTVYDLENEVYKLYNSKGVIIFASRNYPYVSYTEDTLIIEVEDDANGEDKIYVLK